MRLTARKAVEITRELWQWLAENPKRGKSGWPEWEQYGAMASDCACCEYVSRKDHIGTVTHGKHKNCIKYCPLYLYWLEGGGNCEDMGLPYADWLNAHTNEDKTTAALAIVALCDRWLEDNRCKTI